MNKKLLHHYYVDGALRDYSDQHNDGISHGVVRGGEGYRYSLRFDGAGWIEVPHRPSMSAITALRLHVAFAHDEPLHPASAGGPPMRLVEAHQSFALTISPVRGLSLAVRNQAGAWPGCVSAADVIQAGRWHNVDVFHDGVSHAAIWLDGRELVRATLPGQVLPVGAGGISIGRAVEPPLAPLRGWVSEVEIYKHDPHVDTERLTAADCVDHDRVAKLLDRMTKAFGGEKLLRKWAAEFVAVATEAAAALRTPDPHAADAVMTDQVALDAALRSRDKAGFQDAANRLAAHARANIEPAQLKSLGMRLTNLRAAAPVSDQELHELLKALCVEGLAPTHSPSPLTHVRYPQPR